MTHLDSKVDCSIDLILLRRKELMHYTMNKDKTFGFMWNVAWSNGGFVYGTVQIIIGDHIYPKALPSDDHYTLSTVFGNFKESFKTAYYSCENTFEDFGETKFDIKKHDNLQLDNVFIIATTDMGSGLSRNIELDSLLLSMGYSGDTERLFYSFDYGESYREIRYPRGTLESVIDALPKNEDLASFIG